jgi:hypothetical protein
MWNFINIATVDEQKEIIYNIAKERYRGWRSALSATYKAYNNYGERIRNVPEEVHLLEWHCLLLYFGSEKFKVSSSKIYFVTQTLSTKVALLHTTSCHYAEG